MSPKLHSISELDDINEQIIPLKALADKERAAIYGLTGMVYTPYIDEYMQLSLIKAEILSCLKQQGKVAVTNVELITYALDNLHNSAKNNAVVEYQDQFYQRRFSPLKLSKSGKIVKKWAKYWLLQSSNGDIDSDWEAQVKEIWPSYFLINTTDL